MRLVLDATMLLAATCCFETAFAQDFQPTIEEKTNRPGFDYHSFNPPGPDARYCLSGCLIEAQCRSWTYQAPQANLAGRPVCWLKFDVPPQQTDRPDLTSGVVRPLPAPETGSPHKITFRRGDPAKPELTGEFTKANGTIWQETNSGGGKYNFRSAVESRREILLYDVGRDVYVWADLTARRVYVRNGRNNWGLHSEIASSE